MESFLARKTCAGGRVIRTAVELETLRFCEVLEGGGLTIEVVDPEADYSSLHEIGVIEGLLA